MRYRVLALVLVLFSFAAAEDGARFLVICHDSYQNAVQPLVEWRRATGMSAKLVTLSEIGGDSAQVRNYIANAWDNWPTKPEYVLLAASPAQLPGRRYGNRWRYYSDNYYADVSGDVKAEVAIGRLPATTTGNIEEMIAKTLAYERSPDLADPDWMRRLTTIVEEGNDPDDTIYWGNIRYAAQLAGTAGFVNVDSFSANRGHGTSDVINSIDAGTGMVMYRGTAGGYWRPPFNIDPNQTANGRKLPIILSFTCETMSLYPYEPMLGNDWMETGALPITRGIVAFYGNTFSWMNVARQRGAAARGFFTGLFVEGRTRLGRAMLRSKELMLQEFPSDDEDYRGFNLFGDPALRIWTGSPKLLDVTQPFEILPEPQRVDVTVEHDGQPVEGAIVCASMDTTVYAVDTTDAAGLARLDVAPADTGVMRLVVTGQDLNPHDGVILVVDQVGVAEPALPARPEPTSFTAAPSMFTLATSLRWPGTLSVTSVVVRDVSGRQVALLNPTATGEVTWNAEHVRAGVYIATLRAADGRTLASTRVAKTH